MSREHLASKVVVLEEDPRVPAVSALPSAVVLNIGLTERGPIADRTLVTSFAEYVKTFGGFTAYSQVALAAHLFFNEGGSFMWVSRTCHFTDLTNRNSFTAVKATKTLQNSGTLATPGQVTCLTPGPWDMRPDMSGPRNVLDIAVDGAPSVPSTMAGLQASVTDAVAYPCAPLGAGATLTMKVNRGIEQLVTFVGGETTAAQVAAVINGQLFGAHATVPIANVKLDSDRFGTGSYIQVTGGTANATLLFPTGEVSNPAGPTNNVSDLSAVVAVEIEAIVEAAMPGVVNATANPTGTLGLATVATGAAHKIQVAASSSADTPMGFDNAEHSGATNLPQDTLRLDGKTPGTYGNALSAIVAPATSGVASEFNLQILQGGLIKETFPNLTMDSTQTNYVQTIVNHASYGSDLVSATDLGLVLTPTQKRPVDGTFTGFVSGNDGMAGLVDADYVGNVAGPTGLYAFDLVTGGTLLIIPGACTTALWTAMMTYAGTYRNGTLFCVLDPAAGRTKTQIVSDTSTIFESSEYGAVYWPRIKIGNPSTAIFGTGETITVPPSGAIVGVYAKNDGKRGGLYESPAGIGGGFGIIQSCLGVEDDPTGQTRHQVLDENNRDYVYPKRINPICQLEDGGPWHMDGGRTLKSTGSFPHIAQKRGAIFIGVSLKAALQQFRHRYNNRTNRMKVYRMIKAFLIREMDKDAFASKNPKLAFYIDVSDQLNPLANERAGIMTIRVGLGFNWPGEFIDLILTQDTRAYEAELAA